MWKNRVQSTSSGSRTCGQSKTTTAKTTNLQHLSPFASHSTDPKVSTTTTSPKPGSELPTGVRYIRQTPTSVYRPVTNRPIPSTVTKRRERSPEKNLRFADPLQCTRKHDHKTDNKTEDKTVTTKPAAKSTSRARSTSRDRTLVRPVISAEPSPTECKRFSSHNHIQRVVATSPATRQTSPIFSTVDFGGDCNRGSTSRQSPSVEQIPKSANHEPFNDETLTPVANHRPVLDRPVDRSVDRQPHIKTEIMTPNGTVLKRSSAVASKVANNGTIHRNTVSFPMQSSNDIKLDQNRLSVNVNVAVGLDCTDNRMNRYSNQRYNNPLDTEFIDDNVCEDEVDWVPDYGKGFAMQVAVRLRPFIHQEIDSKNNIPVLEMNGNTVRIINSENDNYNRMEYGFDVCLNSSDRDLFEFADQSIVFKRMGEPLLERALEGYNVCLFAYGQTGSGKSFTMTGTDQNPGIIPRFVHELYKRILNLTEVLFAVEVSYYEIYNEKIYDLLSDDKDYNKKILRIREHPQTGPYVENLSQHTVEDYDEVMHLLRNGNRRRATASTAANTDSSRSHSIFTIILSQLKNNSDEMGLDMSCSCGSRINLIDLAGSERVGHSGTSGDRLREGSLINKSLLNLGKVISKLAEYSANPVRTAHIPYRDSALTWLLKESLGGNSQTSMIATISPAKCHLEETLSTIRYAAKARQIVNFVHINEDPKTKKIRELMEIISDLRAKQRIEAFDSRGKETPTSGNSKNTSDESKNSSYDSNTSEQKKTETKSIATNTSFIIDRNDRRMSTKGTETASIGTVAEEKKKQTTSIATNTSFVKPSKTCSTNTDRQPVKTPPKPRTVSTATEMSFIEKEQVDTSTNTSFVELPSRFDLMRFKKLEEQEKQLLEDIRKHKAKLLNDLNRKVEDWGTLGSGRSQNDDPVSGSDTLSLDAYYDAEEVIENESIKSGNTYVVSEDTVDHSFGTVVAPQEVKQSSNKKSNKKKEKKKNKDKNDGNDWQTEDNKTQQKTVPKTSNWNKVDDWNKPLEQIKEVEEEKHVSNDKQSDDWGQEENTTSQQTDNANNDWITDANTNQSEGTVTQTEDNNDEWGTDPVNEDKKDEQSTDWQTEGNTDWGTDDKKESENNENQTQSQDNNTANDWGTDDNQWSEEPKKAEEKQSSDKKSKKKKNKNKDKKSEDNSWGTEDNNKTEDKSNDWNEGEGWDTQPSDQNKDSTQCDDWGTTDSGNKCEEKEENNDWGENTVDNNNQFDWGTDTTETTVIDVKTESNTNCDEEEENW